MSIERLLTRQNHQRLPAAEVLDEGVELRAIADRLQTIFFIFYIFSFQEYWKKVDFCIYYSSVDGLQIIRLPFSIFLSNVISLYLTSALSHCLFIFNTFSFEHCVEMNTRRRNCGVEQKCWKLCLTAGLLQSTPPTVALPASGRALPVSTSNADVLPGRGVR